MVDKSCSLWLQIISGGRGFEMWPWPHLYHWALAEFNTDIVSTKQHVKYLR